MKSKAAMRIYRAGFRLMWRLCPKYLTRIGVPKPGSFRKKNQHGGAMWSLPSECNLTGKQASTIIEKCYEAGTTKDGLKSVRKTMSYAHELTTSIETAQYEEVDEMWTSLDLKECNEGKSLMPMRIPTPEDLKEAFTKEWSPECDRELLDWAAGLVAAWVIHVLGCRSTVDVMKLKKSREHDVNLRQGYISTALVNGRSKLMKRKRGTRPWRHYFVCMCPNGKHIKVPTDVEWKDGSPVDDVTWCTSCPVACIETLFSHQKEERLFPRWNDNAKKFVDDNVGDVVLRANQWLQVQGVCGDEGFSHNAGRKSLGRWLSKVGALYHEGVQVHTDLQDVWRGSYQDDLPASLYKIREQSSDPKDATAALTKFANFCGRAPSEKDPLERLRGLRDQIDGILKALS